MDIDEKEKNQKTVVAFAAGLLIGGLLVWVFSTAPESAAPSETPDTTDAEMSGDADVDAGNTTARDADKGGQTTSVSNSAPTTVPVGNGAITVLDQAAGSDVIISDISHPTTDGWIVVHDDANGALGNALGASRYSTTVGLLPMSVKLLRNTEAGKSYHVVFYSENGDRVFDLVDDQPLMTSTGSMIEAVFKAN